MYSESDVKKAVGLAKWLIEKKQTKAGTAYIIAQNKYKLPLEYRGIIRKEYQKVKGIDPNQTRLF